MDKDRSQILVMEASAGSGKTYALSNRYIDLLLEQFKTDKENPFRSLLAITFTNKAANEMKERIMRFMKELALKNNEDAVQLMGLLVNDYDYFQVQTIDSFVNAVIKSCAYKAGLTADFDIRQDHADFLAYSLDGLIDSSMADKDIKKTFDDFLDHYIFTENKTSWFPRQDILNILKGMYSDSNIYGMGFNKYGTAVDIRTIKNNIYSLMEKLYSGGLTGVNKTFISSLAKFLQKAADGFSVDDISDFFKRDEIPLNKGQVIKKGAGELWVKIKKELKELCEAEAFSTFDCYVDIYNLVMRGFETEAKVRDVLFLEELNQKALRIKDMIDVPELYYRLATRYRHYLLDEFQDTSNLQWNNLYPMIEEGLSTGGTLFYVGDKKQSIYGFRGAMPQLFDSARDHLSQFENKVKTMDMNYRSQKEIVEFNNNIFSGKNLSSFISKTEGKNGDIEEFGEDVLKVFGNSKQLHKEENIHGRVMVESVDDDEGRSAEEIIEEKFVTLVKELKKEPGLDDIAVLCRENDEVQAVTSWLLKENIPVESYITLSIRENAVVKEIVSFLRFLISPVDNLSFGSFITGSVFAKCSGTDADEIRSFIFNWAREVSREKYLYKEFRKKYEKEWTSFIDEFFSSVEFVPLYEFLIRIISRFNIMENFAGQQGFIMKLLEVVKENEEDFQNIEIFLDYFDTTKENLSVNASSPGSVKVLTVHRAKGLGFGTVILPLLKMDVKVTGRNRAGAVIEQDGKLSIVRLKEKYKFYSKILKKIYTGEYKRSFLDELNNVYVALTRAENELYVFIPPRSGNSKNPVLDLLPSKYESGSARTYPYKPAPEVSISIDNTKYSDIIGLLEDDEHIRESKVIDREKKVAGDMAHLVLSFITDLKGRDVDVEINKAFLAAEIKYARQELEKVRTPITKLLKDKRTKQYFFLDKAEIFTEKEMITSEGRLFRLDRLIVTDKEVMIVDYKSSKDAHDKYLQQLKDYMSPVKGIYRKTAVRGFLVYLDTGDIEEING